MKTISPLLPTSLQYACARPDADFQQILRLQRQNLPPALSAEELRTEGFVTAEHDQNLLQRMCGPFSHVTALADGRLAGYALVMLRGFERELPFLEPMFRHINTTEYHGSLLGETPYFVMGQICVDKEFRGNGLFMGLYRHLRSQMKDHFPYVITEVARRNTRSLRAHYKAGFQTLCTYSAEDGEDWVVVIWDWS